VNPLEQGMLGLALEGLEPVAEFTGLGGQRRLDVGQRRAAVDLRFAGSEQPEIRSIQQQDVCPKATLAKERKNCSHSLQIAAIFVEKL
jgi:hypothetical protein